MMTSIFRTPLHRITCPTCVERFARKRAQTREEAFGEHNGPKAIARHTRLVAEAYTRLAEIEEDLDLDALKDQACVGPKQTPAAQRIARPGCMEMPQDPRIKAMGSEARAGRQAQSGDYRFTSAGYRAMAKAGKLKQTVTAFASPAHDPACRCPGSAAGPKFMQGRRNILETGEAPI